jgi:hypothetical protein
MPMPAAVIAVSEKTLSRLGDDPVDRAHRQSPTWGDVYRHHLHERKSTNL